MNLQLLVLKQQTVQYVPSKGTPTDELRQRGTYSSRRSPRIRQKMWSHKVV